MDFLDVMMSFETHTVLEVLFWSNIFLAAMVFSFQTTMMNAQDKGLIHNTVIMRLMFSIAYLLLLWGRSLPDFVSSNLGISILFVAFYLDAHLLLSFATSTSKRYQIGHKIMLITGILAFNVLEVIFDSDAVRSIVSACVLLVIYGVPAIVFVVKKNNSRFKRIIGCFYTLFLISLFPRIIMPITENFASSQEDAIIRSGFYLVLVIITACGTTATMLFIKERSDVILENMALCDQLTQIANRHSFMHYANILFLKCQREKHEISLMFMDIDYFKKINDKYGHDFGDAVLKRFASLIKESVRKYDLTCRYGGEEFLVMVQNDNPGIAETLARRLMERLNSECFDEYPDFRFTISVGIATSVPNEGDTLERYIKNADTALYEAKNNGRNQIQFYQGSVGDE
jgi:diguanylate cyclase (GGDEF)-like protein